MNPVRSGTNKGLNFNNIVKNGKLFCTYIPLIHGH